ncbi:uncharacterized protein LOC134272216 [Saccostrea cucullata]|uniref:uncharacterized protein LOC134272216 n=1 Tax=Saccostrea cuccullata TaxID=36930 RepID=UPI002ED57DC9
MMGIGVVEVTIIIVGILAVKRFREQRKSSMKRTSKEANDRRPVSRKTIFGIDNVYDTIPFDESDENPYKDLSDGVYDTTSKRRSHVNRQRSNYSRGSFFLHLFHKSNHNERKSIEENIPLPLRKETIEKV